MSRRKWTVNKLNKELAAKIAERFSIDPFTALLMSQRGFETETQISEFLSDEPVFSDPFLLPDMQKAVDRINEAIFDYEQICIYGDYDADGVTATALLYSYLEAQGANVTYMLPDRERDGYGLSRNAVDRIKAEGTSLIITVDNGIAAVDEAEYIKELGMEMVVTDHHLPGAVLPDCVAVVDPHREDAKCPYRDFAGVGVAFKLACAIEGNADSVLYDFAYLAVIGTVADIVPLTGENRTIVKQGLASLNAYPHPGAEALISVCGCAGKTITSSNISFGLAPRINAAGRMSSAEKALDLLLCEEPGAAEQTAQELEALNAERHREENVIFTECCEFLNKNPEYAYNPVLVMHGKDWHEGVLGIVASKLLEKYQRPVIVLTEKGDVSKGSARSIEGFSIFEALKACSEHLSVYGGHEQAAGLTLPTANIDAFVSAINDYAFGRPAYPEMHIDCKLNPETMSVSLLASLEALEPFGAENKSPVFGLFDMVIDNVTALGDRKQHLRITAHKNGKTKQVTMMRFNAPHGSFPYRPGDIIDAAVVLDRNEWNHEVKLSVIVKDIRPSGIDDEMMASDELLFNYIFLRRPLTKEQAEYALPDRKLFADVYTYLKKNPGLYAEQYEYLYSAVCGKEHGNNICRVRVVLVALTELGLVSVSDDGAIIIPEVSGKSDLLSAPVMKYLNEF